MQITTFNKCTYEPAMPLDIESHTLKIVHSTIRRGLVKPLHICVSWIFTAAVSYQETGQLQHIIQHTFLLICR